MNPTRLLSALAGLLIAAGLPPWGWWPLTIVGLGLWFHLLDHARPRTRFRRSLLVGGFWAFPSTLWLVDLTAQYQLTPSVRLFARGTNLLDEDYEQVYGYRTLGRAGYLGVRIGFGQQEAGR